MSSGNRTSLKIIGYGLYLYFLGLSFRNIAKALSFVRSKNKPYINFEMDTKVQTMEISQE